MMCTKNSNVYKGEWNNGFKDGPGTYRWRDGEVDVSRYSSDYRVGEGARWSEDRKRSFRLVHGSIQEEIDLREADWIARRSWSFAALSRKVDIFRSRVVL